MDAYMKIPIVKVREGSCSDADDLIAVEKRLKISVNGKPALSLYCTPLMVRELVVGIVHSEGLIAGEWCAERMTIDYGDDILVDIPASGTIREGERTITSGCGGGISISRRPPDETIKDPSAFSIETIKQIFREFQMTSESYRLTGGVHSAALTDGAHMIAFAEDIGRHNAVDKVIGRCLLESIPFAGKILLASGRLSSEIVSKCARSGIPALVSRAAPTSLAVAFARKAGLTMIGFARGDRMNIYTGRARIIL